MGVSTPQDDPLVRVRHRRRRCEPGRVCGGPARVPTVGTVRLRLTLRVKVALGQDALARRGEVEVLVVPHAAVDSHGYHVARLRCPAVPIVLA